MNIVGQSPNFQEILRTVQLVSLTDAPVLLLGEAGTGKRTLASELHCQSHRKSQRFIKVNCSTLDEEQAEALLFGRKKLLNETADFDQSCIGYIAQAKNGTLLLNEVSSLPEKLQAKLLHFIESGEIQTLGENIPQKVDTRLVVTSSKDLFDEVEAGRFNADLYYRLNIVPVTLPTLAERSGDVKKLMSHFLNKLVKEHQSSAPSFSKMAMKQIIQYNWPGNVRELECFCERMFILFGGIEVGRNNLPQELSNYARKKSSLTSPFSLPSTGIQLDEVESDLIRQAMQKANGNKAGAARLLGLTRDTFLYRLKKYALSD